jgi:hypothetical protein
VAAKCIFLWCLHSKSLFVFVQLRLLLLGGAAGLFLVSAAKSKSKEDPMRILTELRNKVERLDKSEERIAPAVTELQKTVRAREGARARAGDFESGCVGWALEN